MLEKKLKKNPKRGIDTDQPIAVARGVLVLCTLMFPGQARASILGHLASTNGADWKVMEYSFARSLSDQIDVISRNKMPYLVGASLVDMDVGKGSLALSPLGTMALKKLHENAGKIVIH